jgi:hypothetical protein
MKGRKKSLYHFRSFHGPDISIAISLFEYGIAWKEVRKDAYLFVIGIDSGRMDSETNQDIVFNRFTYFHMSRKDFVSLCGEKWFDIAAVAESSETTRKSFVEGFPEYVQDAVLYHGYENVFGSVYHEGFQIKE